MNDFIVYLSEPYKSYENWQIALETFATFFGILSVYFSAKRNIWVFPTGIISTFIYIFLFFNWGLYGETLINLYYTSMSIYGWILWSKQTQEDHVHVSVKWANFKDYCQAFILFIITFLLILCIYHFRPIIDGGKSFTEMNLLSWNYTKIDFIDASLTGFFLIGMWMMAKRKIDNWFFWILGDLIMVPLLIYKGYAISSFQYFVFTILAIIGLLGWMKTYQTQS